MYHLACDVISCAGYILLTISLSTRLCGLGVCCQFCSGTSVPSSLISSTSVDKGVTHELGDYVYILCRSVIIRFYVKFQLHILQVTSNFIKKNHNILWSTGSKLVSFLLSNPVANCIRGTVQEPKSPILELPADALLTLARKMGLQSACSMTENKKRE